VITWRSPQRPSSKRPSCGYLNEIPVKPAVWRRIHDSIAGFSLAAAHRCASACDIVERNLFGPSLKTLPADRTNFLANRRDP
jgi:hypothetical protein